METNSMLNGFIKRHSMGKFEKALISVATYTPPKNYSKNNQVTPV